MTDELAHARFTSCSDSDRVVTGTKTREFTGNYVVLSILIQLFYNMLKYNVVLTRVVVQAVVIITLNLFFERRFISEDVFR